MLTEPADRIFLAAANHVLLTALQKALQKALQSPSLSAAERIELAILNVGATKAVWLAARHDRQPTTCR